mgnify:CR=1 FL=1
MGLPILPHEQRPYIRLKKRTGTFPDGSQTYDPLGDFTITLNENKVSVVSGRIDNTPLYGTARYIDSLSVGDNAIIVMKDASGNEDCVFYGLIESIEYTGENNTVDFTAADHSVYGENVYLNSVLYQKFTSNEEVSMHTRGNDEYYTTLPTDTTSYAPVVIEMRQTYGSNLNAAWNFGGQENNNGFHTKTMPVYSAPTPAGFELRTVGGLGRPDYDDGEGTITYYPDDTDPNSTTQKPTSTLYGDPINGPNVSKNRIATNKQSSFQNGARKFVAQVFTPNQDDQLTWIYFNINKCIRRYPSQMNSGKATMDNLAAWGSPWDLAPSGDPAKIALIESGSYTDGAGNTCFNSYSAISEQNNDFGFQHVVGVPQGGPIDTANFGQPYNTFGPGMDLKVTLVRCVEADADSEGTGVTVTKVPQHVPNKTFVPTPDRAAGYGNSYINGVDWANDDRVGSDFANATVLATITIEPDNPVPAPHYPAGAQIVTQYLSQPSSMIGMSGMDEGQFSAFTQFGWNLESTPISVEKGEKYALIFEMLGDPAHPKLDDGVDIGGDANPGFLTPSCWWNVMAQLNSATGDQVFSTQTRPYSGGEFLASMLTDANGQYTGHHGEFMWNPVYRCVHGHGVVFWCVSTIKYVLHCSWWRVENTWRESILEDDGKFFYWCYGN